MRFRSTIRPIVAFGMLLLLFFSIMPKVYLHAVFADHHDIPVKVSQTGEAHLSADGFSCDINDQVATSPFTTQVQHLHIQPAPLFPTSTTQHLIANLHLQGITVVDLRGPPASI